MKITHIQTFSVQIGSLLLNMKTDEGVVGELVKQQHHRYKFFVLC